MRRMGDLMKDLGFNANAPVDTQKAFIRHLIHVANGGTRGPMIQLPEVPAAGEQLAFDNEILGFSTKKKSAA